MQFLEDLIGLLVGFLVVVPLYLGIRLFLRWILFGDNIFSYGTRNLTRDSERLDRISKNLDILIEEELRNNKASSEKFVG